MPDRGDLGNLAIAIFEQWRTQGVEFLILRNYETLPERTRNDIDVLLRPQHIAKAEKLLIGTARAEGYRLHNRAAFVPVSLFLYQPESLQQVQFDLFTQLKWRGFSLLSCDLVLNQRVERRSFAIPHPAHEAVINLLSRLIYHGYVKEEYKPAIGGTFKTDPIEPATQLAKLFGRKLAADQVASIVAGDWPRVESRCGAMRRRLAWRQLTHHPLSTGRSVIKDLIRLAGRVVHLPGITVMLVGPDGCGKSTVAKKLANALHGSFHVDKSVRVSWKPSLIIQGRRAARRARLDARERPHRGVIVSALVLVYHWAELLARHWTQYMPILFRNGLVLVERGHYDLIVDPRRFRLASLPRFVRLLFSLAPSPDLVFVLDVPPEVLQSRTPTMSLAEAKCQREAYRTSLSGASRVHVVNADQSVECVVRELTRCTLEYLAARQDRRSTAGEPTAKM